MIVKKAMASDLPLRPQTGKSGCYDANASNQNNGQGLTV
jgi:hypothetical protein